MTVRNRRPVTVWIVQAVLIALGFLTVVYILYASLMLFSEGKPPPITLTDYISGLVPLVMLFLADLSGFVALAIGMRWGRYLACVALFAHAFFFIAALVPFQIWQDLLLSSLVICIGPFVLSALLLFRRDVKSFLEPTGTFERSRVRATE